MKKRVFLVVLIPLFCFLFLLSFTSLTLLVIGDFGSVEQREFGGEYFATTTGHRSNTESTKMVKLSGLPNEEAHLSYSSKDNLFSTASKYGGKSTKYRCFGTCECSRSVESRRLASSLTKPLYFLVSAFSLTFAIGKANDIFQSDCARYLASSDCPDDEVDSRVDSCEVFDEKEEVEEEEDLKEKKRTRLYECVGYCVPNQRLKVEQVVFVRDSFECQSKVVRGAVHVAEEGVSMSLHNSKAIESFLADYLVPFCKSVSQYDYARTYKKTGSEVLYNVHVTARLCVAVLTKPKNANIKCEWIR